MPTSTQRFRLVGEDDASRAFLQVAAASRLLKSSMDDVSSSVLGLGKLMGGASLTPILAGTSAAVVELTTSLGAAAGAGGIFGLSVVGQVKAMATQQKAIKVTETSLAKLSKGSSDYNDKLKELNAQQKSFNQQFGPAAKGLNDMSDSWGKFLHATAPVTNGVLGKGMELIASVLPKLVPVSNAAGKAIGGLIDDLSNWTEGPAFAHLLHFLETSGPKAITAFGHSIGNTLSGLGGILGNFVGPGDNAAKTLEHMTRSFDKWGHSKGVSDSTDRFLKYVSDNGPEISSTFKSLGEAAPKVASALGKLGAANLSVTSRFLNLIAGMPQGAFNVVVGGMFGIAAASRAITAVTGISAILTGIKGVAGGGGLAGKGGGILGAVGGGVQKVFVTNPGFGAGGGGGGVPVGAVAKGGAATAVEADAAIAAAKAGAAVKAAGGSRAEIAAAISKAFKGGIADGAANAAKAFNFGKIGGAAGLFRTLLGAPLPALGSVGNQSREKVTGGQAITLHGAQAQKVFNNTAFVDGTSRKIASLNAQLGKASQAMDLVGHSAQRAFAGQASAAVTGLSGKLQKINGSKASQALDLVGHSAAKNFANASGRADDFRGKLNSIPSSKTVKVNADTGAARAAVQSIASAIAGIQRVVNVHVNVSRSTNANIAEVSGNGSRGGGGSGGGAVAHGGSGGGMAAGRGVSGGFGVAPRVSWWQGTGSHLLSSIVGRGKMPLSHILSGVRGAKQANNQRLQNTIGARNSFADGFQGFASSAFGADYGTDPTSGAAVAPTISSILTYAQSQRSQAAMVKTGVKRLVKLGLSPALLKQLQAAGQAGIPTIQALAGADKSQIAQYNSLNKATSSDLRSAGMTAGNRIFGQQISKEEKHNAAIEHLLTQLVDMAKHHPDQLVARLQGDHIDLLLANTRRRKGKLQSDKTP